MKHQTVELHIQKLEHFEELQSSVSKYEVIAYEYMFDKDYDRKGTVMSNVKGGTIHFSLSAFPDDDLIAWVLNHRKLVSGQLLILDETKGIKDCHLQFEGARCVKCKIKYALVAPQLCIQLSVNAAKIVLGGVDFSNK